MKTLLSLLRRLQTRLKTLGKSRYLSHGSDLHIGAGTRLWALHKLQIEQGYDHCLIKPALS